MTRKMQEFTVTREPSRADFVVMETVADLLQQGYTGAQVAGAVAIAISACLGTKAVAEIVAGLAALSSSDDESDERKAQAPRHLATADGPACGDAKATVFVIDRSLATCEKCRCSTAEPIGLVVRCSAAARDLPQD